MPEIAEVARLVHFLRQFLVGRKIHEIQAVDDINVFGKVGCSGPAFKAAMEGRLVREAGSQGKYFWLVMDHPPHPVMHLGMTGWIHIQDHCTAYTNYSKRMSPEEQGKWPPKYWKFQLETQGVPTFRVAFTDPRRFGRIRLIECPGGDIRKHSPLVDNGPDPVVDKAVFTVDFLRERMRKRHVPLKALILDQTVISGIGNWVADESLYQARLHPEQYCDEFSDEEVKRLHEAITYVCQTACDLLADSDKFPDNWLFNHRWGKGKSTPSRLPNGEKLAFIKVGGRTSCYAPGLQKKTGYIAPGIKEAPVQGDADQKPNKAKAKGSARSSARASEAPASNDGGISKRIVGRSKREPQEADPVEGETWPHKKMRRKQEGPLEVDTDQTTNGTTAETGAGRRRSARLLRTSQTLYKA